MVGNSEGKNYGVSVRRWGQIYHFKLCTNLYMSCLPVCPASYPQIFLMNTVFFVSCFLWITLSSVARMVLFYTVPVGNICVN